MDTTKTVTSPRFRNLLKIGLHSPLQLKENLRKNYKERIKQRRTLHLSCYRRSVTENDLKETLEQLLKEMFGSVFRRELDDDEFETINEIQKELVDAELNWTLEEYEKELSKDINSFYDGEVVCPQCQKVNLDRFINEIECKNCLYKLKCNVTLSELKHFIINAVEKHSDSCTSKPQMAVILDETNENHLYLLCESCNEMLIII